MKSKSTSNFQKNFIFNACMNQSGFFNDKNDKVQPQFTSKSKKKMVSAKTLGKPLSMNDLNLNKKGKFMKKPELCSPFQQIIKNESPHKKVPQVILTNSSHHANNQTLHYEDLAQSQHSRKSRYEGNKIKIFSNQTSNGNINEDRTKSLSRDSFGTSASRQKRGIQVTKTLLKKISGMYCDQDFNRNSQPSMSNRSSHYQKSQKKMEQDSFHNQTGFMMTTWDSQRTNQEYQLSRDYECPVNRTGNDNFGLVTYGTVNSMNQSYENNRGILPKNNISYSNEITEYSMRQDSQRHSNKSVSEHVIKNPTSLTSSTSIKMNSQTHHIKQAQYQPSAIPLPVQYQQRPSYHLTVRPAQQKKKSSLSNSLSRPGKLMIKSQQKAIPQILSNSTKKPSLMFNVNKQIPKLKTNITTNKNPLFQTAHQILSQQVSSLTQPYPYTSSRKEISGEQLTNLIYGNKDIDFKNNSRMTEEQREKYILKYKNKTLEDLSVKNSMVEGYGDYYQ